MQFTANQSLAIDHDSTNMQLIACAGSGKTEVVARHVARLLENGAEPRNIVALTFTDRAAAELKARIWKRHHETNGQVVALVEMYVGTIHGFCLDLIQTESPEHLKYEVINEIQEKLFVDRHSRQAGLTTTVDLAGRRLRRYVDTNRYTQALDIIREDKVERADESIYGGLAAYEHLMRESAYFDYSSILVEALRLLAEIPTVRERIAERIRHVIVDEYQDVNPIQEALVSTLHGLGARIVVVGDDDQTIYQWRGSDVENILTFDERYPSVLSIKLEDNFRSSEGIVATARAFIEEVPLRLEKEMTPASAQSYEKGDITALGFHDPDEEATHIAETIQGLVGLEFCEADGERRGLAYSDVAILLRSVKANAAPITTALRKVEIPFIVVGMNDLLETEEAQAARTTFYFMAERTSLDDVKQAWTDADLGLPDRDLDKALEQLETARADLVGAQQRRWGLYSPQRVFLEFLETAGLREERVPGGRGEVVFYNLGKFSQAISDFESIHFHSKPEEKYKTFADFLYYSAEDAYPEGWQDNAYANPNAVRIMTVHQAKGMQWPAVFLPALLRNRFPSPRIGGQSVWHILPAESVQNQARYQGSIDDERRLFYVAMTRAEKFLFFSWAPIPGKGNRYVRPSRFFEDVLASKYVKRRDVSFDARSRAPQRPREGVADVTLTFSDLKYYFVCPYQFKLRILYGFNRPIDEALGYGKSLHDALAEVHFSAMNGVLTAPDAAEELAERHLRVPFAYPSLRDDLQESAEDTIRNYLHDNADLLPFVEFSEKSIEIDLGNGIRVVGRIDLVRRVDTGTTTIVDLKSTRRAQAEDVTEEQLHIYALGYRELTGRDADQVEIYNLDERRAKPRSVDEEFIEDVQADVRSAAAALREGRLPTVPNAANCAACDFRLMCTDGMKAAP